MSFVKKQNHYITGFVVFLISNITNAEPAIDISFNFYEIHPISKSDLSKEMNKKSPINKNGIIFKGHTQWYVKWSFKWQQRRGTCKISQVETSLSVIYTMPKISDNIEVPHSIRQSFKHYYAVLLLHEKGHMTSGLFAARDIEHILIDLGSFSNCKKLADFANAKGDEIIKKYNKLDKEYDRNTDHGKSQGVNINNFM